MVTTGAQIEAAVVGVYERTVETNAHPRVSVFLFYLCALEWVGFRDASTICPLQLLCYSSIVGSF